MDESESSLSSLPALTSQPAETPLMSSASESAQSAVNLPVERLPRHIAIIMDGNGRWAVQRNLPRIEGHRRGANAVEQTVEACARLGVQQLTLYCFSSENWKRPQEEQNFLMELLERFVIEQRDRIMRNNIRLKIIGRRRGLPDSALAETDRTIEMSRANTGTTLCLAINYGARGEMVDAVQQIAEQVKAGSLQPEDIDEQTISDALYTAEMPDPDLLIRTAGEMRVSNFLLWQISYAELWVSPKCWPDFEEADLHQAILDFARRDRRFGGLNS